MSLSEHPFDAQPHRTDKTSDDDRDDGLERIALRLLDALPPTTQMLEIRPQLRLSSSSTPKDVRIDATAFETIASIFSFCTLCRAAIGSSVKEK